MDNQIASKLSHDIPEIEIVRVNKYLPYIQSFKMILYRILFISVLLLLWEYMVSIGKIDPFLLGSPLTIINVGINMYNSGQLLNDIWATIYATVSGFIIGSIIGSIVGLSLWYFKKVADILDPLIVALNGVPKIALAPMIVIWFGTDIFSKIILALISTFVVAMLSAYQATKEIEETQINLLRSFGATKTQIFTKVIIPASFPWIISAFRINIGLALVSVVGGEFISSDVGLGHMIFVEGNLFNIPAVWVGVLMLMLVAILLYLVVGSIEKKLLPSDFNR